MQLEELYRQVILDHYRNPRRSGSIQDPDATAEGHNPLCGDEVTIELDFDGDTVADAAVRGRGCSISQASASMMSAAIKGKTLSEVDDLTAAVKAMMSIHEQELEDDDSGVLPEPPDVELGDLEALKGVVKFPVRIKCATLGWNTLAEALSAGS